MAVLIIFFFQILSLLLMERKGGIMFNEQLPVGLGLSLAMNQRAMERFANMTETQKQQTIDKSRQVKSKREMDRIVNSLAEDDDEELKSFFN